MKTAKPDQLSPDQLAEQLERELAADPRYILSTKDKAILEAYRKDKETSQHKEKKSSEPALGKTIKQIADELGVDKQRVYRYIKKNHISEAHHERDTKYYDEAAETLISQHFSNCSASDEAHHDSHQTASSDTVVDTVIAMLQGELSIKNKQIAELTAALENTTSALREAQTTAQAAQALHAGTIHKQLTDGRAEPTKPETAPGLLTRIAQIFQRKK